MTKKNALCNHVCVKHSASCESCRVNTVIISPQFQQVSLKSSQHTILLIISSCLIDFHLFTNPPALRAAGGPVGSVPVDSGAAAVGGDAAENQ